MTTNTIKIVKSAGFDDICHIEPCTVKRDWMEANEGHAYRCLPLNIANQHGWAVYLKKEVSAVWNGDQNPSSKNNIEVISNPFSQNMSHFGNRVLTFPLPFVVRTSPGWNLYISGAPNHQIRGIQPLTGIFEADWAPFSFTMNWRFTEPYTLAKFTTKDPVCFFFPIRRDSIEDFNLEFCEWDDQEQEYTDEINTFHKLRHKFLNSPRDKKDWQRMYYTGKTATGKKLVDDHKIKLRLDKGD